MSGILLARLYDAGYSRADVRDWLVDLFWYLIIASLVIDAIGYTVDFIKWVAA